MALALRLRLEGVDPPLEVPDPLEEPREFARRGHAAVDLADRLGRDALHPGAGCEVLGDAGARRDVRPVGDVDVPAGVS